MRLCFSVVLVLFLLSDVLTGWSSFTPRAAAAALKQLSSPQASMTFQQFLKEGRPAPKITPSAPRTSPPASILSKGKGPVLSQLPPHAEPATMHPLTFSLTPSFQAGSVGVKPLDLVGSDQRLEVQIRPGLLDLSHATIATGGAPAGTLTLHVTQIHGHFVGSTSVLGTYTLQLDDAQGHVVRGARLRTPITFLYHYQLSELQRMDLDPGRLFFTWPNEVFAARQTHQPTAAFIIPLHNDPTTHTLTAQSTVLGSQFDVGGGDPTEQSPPKPHLASVQGNAGQLSYSYPLTVAPGPPGTTPALTLTYSSGSANGRTSLTSPSSEVGDGWSLTLGSISASQYPTGSAQTGTWYALNDVDNVSDRLVPNGSQGAFVTEHLAALKVQQLQKNGQPCFHVWAGDGTYSEYGCTTDSLQYHTDSNGTRTNYRWDLDAMTPPNEGTADRYLHVSYEQDIVTISGHVTIRDAVMKQITYGVQGGSVAGTIDFTYLAPFTNGTWTTAYQYGSNYHCTPLVSTPLRCDDPLDYPGGLPAPTVMNTFSLQTVTSYVGDDSSATRKAASYRFSYNDSSFLHGWDDYTQIQQYHQGTHQLTSVVPTMYLGGTAHQLKPLQLGYSGALQDSYSDLSEKILNGTQNYSLQIYGQYLTSYRDTTTGVGATITYQTAYGNTHGTPVVATPGNPLGPNDDRYDPLHCSTYHDCGGSYTPDDGQWSQQVVTSITSLGKDSSASGLTPATTTYRYRLAHTSIGTTCNGGDCVGDNWIPVNGSTQDGDWLDFHHAEFRGFNIVYTTSPAGDLTAAKYASTKGWATQASDYSNYIAGSLYEEDIYSGNSLSGPLLRQTINAYAGNNSAANSCNGNLTRVYPPCAVLLLSNKTTDYEGTALGNTSAPWVEQDNTYDDYNSSSGLGAGYNNLLQQVISGSNVSTVTKKWTYQTTDTTVSGWVYHNVQSVVHSELDDSAGHVQQCQNTTYDEGASAGVPSPAAGLPTTVTTYSDCSKQSTSAITQYNGYDANANQIASVDGVGTANSSLYSSAGCRVQTPLTILSTHWTSPHFTTCMRYDSYATRLALQINVLKQSTSTTYDDTQGGLPISATDLNTQVTQSSYAYDSNGNPSVSVSQPGETGSYTSLSGSNSTCTSSSTLPCFEMDRHSRLYANAITRTFYDAQDRKVETRTPGPGAGDDTIVYTVYNDSTNSTFQSVPFEVVRGSNWVDPNSATDINGQTPGGTATFLDALGRTIAVQDPSFGSAQEPGLSCSATLTGTYTACTNYGLGTAHGDTTTYVYTQGVDPNNHMTVSFADVLGRTRYTQQYSGHTGSLSSNVVQQQRVQYNALNKPTSVQVTDLAPQSGQSITSVTTTAQYDDLGRVTQAVDPDRGTHTYAYDANGQVLTDTATSGSSSRTFGYNYDLLGRAGCAQLGSPTINATGACTAGNTPLIQNTYDTSVLGGSDNPVGRLTQQVARTIFPDASYGQVTDQMQYDARGRVSQKKLLISVPGTWNMSSGLPSDQLTQSYNNANQPTTSAISTSDGHGYTFTQVYDGTTGVQTGLSSGTSQTANLATLSYTVNAQLASINFLSSTGTPLASEQFSYDANLRPTSTVATWQSGSGTTGTILSHARSYDLAGNVTTVNETLAAVPGATNSGGSELQVFCYDEQNRLAWAGNQGTAPGAGTGTCGSGTPSGTLSGGNYGTSFVATHLGQLWQGPLSGSGTQQQYLYCDSAHPHQVSGLYTLGTTCATRTTSNTVYSGSYDDWGNLTTRSYSGIASTLNYDALDHLVHWDGHAGASEDYLYDASGERVLRRAVKSTGTEIFTYPFGLMDIRYSSTGVQVLENDYYALAGRLIGEQESGVTIFLLTDELGSVLTSISAAAGSAAVTSNQVYSPYGAQRYRKGMVPTDKGFTGQYLDASGLNYDHARYYDAVAGRFVSADIKQGNAQGMDPYSYVGNNPETLNDPTGQYWSNGISITQQGGAVGWGNTMNGTFTTVINDGLGNVWTADNHYSYSSSGLSRDTFTGEQIVKYGGYNPNKDQKNSPGAKIGRATGWTDMVNTWNDPHASGWDKAGAVWNFATKNANNLAMAAMILGGDPAGDLGLAALDDAPAVVDDTVTLYRSVNQFELKDILDYGDYGLNPHGGGKYFAYTEEGSIKFAQTAFNREFQMTLTKMDIPVSWLQKGFDFFDTGGAGASIHFEDEILPDLYEVMTNLTILGPL